MPGRRLVSTVVAEASVPAELFVLRPLNGRPESITQMVYELIRDAIVSKALSPGSRLSEASLASQLNVSKTPVREALLRLEAIGIAERDGIRGVRVVGPSRSLILHAYEVRGAHESVAARLAAERATDSQIDAIDDAALKSLESAKAGDGARFLDSDYAFHEAVATSAANPLLRTLVNNSFVLTSVLRRRDVPATHEAVSCGEQHVRIGRMIRRHDPERAGTAMLAHINKVRASVLAALEESLVGGA